MIRQDVASETLAAKMCRAATDVLPHALYNETAGPPDAAGYRETIEDCRKYVNRVLAALERTPTVPNISQDRFTHSTCW